MGKYDDTFLGILCKTCSNKVITCGTFFSNSKFNLKLFQNFGFQRPGLTENISKDERDANYYQVTFKEISFSSQSNTSFIVRWLLKIMTLDYSQKLNLYSKLERCSRRVCNHILNPSSFHFILD